MNKEEFFPGIYKHYKGKYYRLLNVAQSSEDQTAQVIYQALYGNCEIWSRPAHTWSEIITLDGKEVKRFEYIDMNKYESENKNNIIDKVALLYIKDGKVIGARSKGKDIYYFPGGKREGSETDLECLSREIEEELGVQIVETSARFYGTYYAQAHGKPDGVLIKMKCYQAEFVGDLSPNNEIEEIGWMSYKDRDNGSPVDKIIKDELYQKGLINLKA